MRRVYEIEKRIKTPEKFRFPMFQTTNWYAAKHIYDQIKGESSGLRIISCILEIMLM